jgi:small subunit ribosomal protein S17
MAEKVSTRGRKNTETGQVISDKMDKTISVLVYRNVRHAKYGKFIKRTSVFKAHDEKNTAKTGDTVKIFSSRALSKTKRWKLMEVVQRAKVKEGAGV